MDDKNSGWSIDIPKDPNKVRSYSSSYTGNASYGGYITYESFENSLKKESIKSKSSENKHAKSKNNF